MSAIFDKIPNVLSLGNAKTPYSIGLDITMNYEEKIFTNACGICGNAVN